VSSVEGFLLDFLQSALVQKIKINWDRVCEQLDYALDQLKDLLLLVNAAYK
jgi:hypothetical protein